MSRLMWLCVVSVGLLNCDAFVQDVLPLLAGLHSRMGPRDSAGSAANDSVAAPGLYGVGWRAPKRHNDAARSGAEMTRPGAHHVLMDAIPAIHEIREMSISHGDGSEALPNITATPAAALLRSLAQRDVDAAAAANSAIAAFSLLLKDQSIDMVQLATVATFAGTLLMDAGHYVSAQMLLHSSWAEDWSGVHFLRAAELGHRMGQSQRIAWPLLDTLVRHQLRVPASAFPNSSSAADELLTSVRGLCSSPGASLLMCPALKPSSVPAFGLESVAARFKHGIVAPAGLAQLPSAACTVDALLALADTTRMMGRYRDTERLLNTASEAIIILLSNASLSGVSQEAELAVRTTCAGWNSSHARLAALRTTHAYRCLARTRAYGASSAHTECVFESLTPALSSSLRRHAQPRTLDANTTHNSSMDTVSNDTGDDNSTWPPWPQRFAELMLSALVAQSVTDMQSSRVTSLPSPQDAYQLLRMQLMEGFGLRGAEAAAGLIAEAAAYIRTDDPALCETAGTQLENARQMMIERMGRSMAWHTQLYVRTLLLTIRSRSCADSRPTAATHNATLAQIINTRDALRAVYNGSHPAVAELDSIAALTTYARERGHWTCSRVQLPHTSSPATLANATIPFLSCQERDAMRACKASSAAFDTAMQSWAALPRDVFTHMRAAFTHMYMTWEVRYNATRFMTLTQAAAQHALLAADVASPHARMLLPPHVLAGAGVNSSALANAYTQTDFSPLSNVLNAEHAQVILVQSAGGTAAAHGRPPPARLSAQQQAHVASLSQYSTALTQLRKLSTAARVVVRQLSSAKTPADEENPVCLRVVLQDAVTVFRQITRALAGIALTLLDSTGNGGADLAHPASIFTQRMPGMTDEDLLARQRVWRVLAESAAVADKMYEMAQSVASNLTQAYSDTTQSPHAACQNRVDEREVLHVQSYSRADVMRAYALGGVVDLLHSVTLTRHEALEALTQRVAEGVVATLRQPGGITGLAVWRDTLRTGEAVLLTRAQAALQVVQKRFGIAHAQPANDDDEDEL